MHLIKMKIKKDNKIKKQSVVEWMIENAPSKKIKVAAEKKILIKKLLKKNGYSS